MFRPESERRRAALLAVATLDDAAATADRVRGLLAESDRLWVDLARFDLAPRAHAYLQHTGGHGGLPVSHCQWLEAVFARNAVRQALLQRRAAELSAALHQNGIEVVWLKGLALSMDVYHPAGLRMMEDVDLLIPRDAGREGVDLLLARGFEPHPHEDLPDLSRHAAQLRRRDPDLGGDGWLNVDLHFEVLQIEDGGRWTDLVWEHARPAGVAEALRPSAELSLLLVALHLFFHYLNPKYLFRAASDAAALLDASPEALDGAMLAALAAQPVVAAALVVLLELLPAARHRPAGELAGELRSRLRGRGLEGRLDSIQRSARSMRTVRPFDPCLDKLGRSGSLPRAAAAFGRRLFSPSRLREHRVLRGEDPAGSWFRAFRAWLRTLSGANWRYAATSYRVGRFEAEAAPELSADGAEDD